MGKRSCIFCGATGGLSKEHVIPLWLQRYVGGEEKVSFRGTHMSWVGMPLSQRKASGNSHTIGVVCSTCNNGWMSRLESDFQELLPRLLLGVSPRRLSKPQRHTIAAWITKTGIVAHHSSNYRVILPNSLPHSLQQGRSIPSGIKVISGKSNTGKTIQWAQSNLRSAILHKTDYAFFDPKQTFVFVLSIRDIFIGFGWHGLSHERFEVFRAGNSTHQIYPHPKPAKRPCVFDDLFIATNEIALRSKGI